MKKILWIVIFGVIGLIFHRFLFSLYAITSGDYTQLQSQTLHYFSYYSFSAWDSSLNLGINYVGLLNHAPFNLLTGILGQTGIAIQLLERLVWWVPFLAVGGLSIYLLSKSLQSHACTPLSIILYVANTYILLVLAGGQIQGIGLAYALAPLLLVLLQKICDTQIRNKTRLQVSIFYGVLLAIQMGLDPRITYISLVASILYGLVYVVGTIKSRKELRNSFWVGVLGFVLPISLLGLLHAFWILPTLLVHENPLNQFGSAYTTTNAVEFFSFAKFENTLGLLHPNWPENIFGKTYFMRPEFLLLPILAFSPLLFVKRSKDEEIKRRNRNILFFALLGIVGVFLAKGAQEPFGRIYVWMFNHIPGFVMFRDPTKWYVLIAISYAVLIPFTIIHVYELLSSKVKRLVPIISIILIVGYLLLLINPAILGQLPGTFQTHTIPWEYQKLSSDLQADSHFSRTLWVPVPQRYAFSSSIHPKVSAVDLFQKTNLSDLLHEFGKSSTKSYLQQIGVKYVAVPDDSEKEIFLKDRKYDPSQYVMTIAFLQKISWLKEQKGFGKIVVFAVSDPKDHFWIADSNATVTYRFVSPTDYVISLKHAKKGDSLIFAESYNSHWVFESESIVPSRVYSGGLNSFVVPTDGDITGRLVFSPQAWVDKGILVSIVTCMGVIVYFLITSFKGIKK